MINKNFILEYKEPFVHADMMEYLDKLNARYRFLRIIYIGKSMCGKSIPAIKIGSGDKNIVYAGGITGKEAASSMILLRYINEFCELMRTDQRVYNVGIDYIYKTRSIYIIPMVNPDGIEFGDEKTADTGLVAGFMNTLSGIKLMNTFRINGNYITCPEISAFRMQSLIKLYARMTGCRIQTEKNCVYGALEKGRYPIFDISCEGGEFFKTYMSVRELLFTAPILC